MKKKIYLLVVLAILLEGYYAWSRREGNKANPKYYFGMVPDAYSPKEFVNDNVQTLSYWIKMNFPADSVVSYYEESLKVKGWSSVELKNQGIQKKWTYGIRIDPSSSVPDCAYTYLSAWVNSQKNRIIQLTLVYYDPSPAKVCPPGPKNNELVVTLQELPFQP